MRNDIKMRVFSNVNSTRASSSSSNDVWWWWSEIRRRRDSWRKTTWRGPRRRGEMVHIQWQPEEQPEDARMMRFYFGVLFFQGDFHRDEINKAWRRAENSFFLDGRACRGTSNENANEMTPTTIARGLMIDDLFVTESTLHLPSAKTPAVASPCRQNWSSMRYVSLGVCCGK